MSLITAVGVLVHVDISCFLESSNTESNLASLAEEVGRKAAVSPCTDVKQIIRAAYPTIVDMFTGQEYVYAALRTIDRDGLESTG